MYYGPEFRSIEFKNWATQHHILVHYIQPGKPAQNGFIERFNRTYREDVLDMNLFDDVREVRAITQEWVIAYNEERPHEALAGMTPLSFAKQRMEGLEKHVENSTFK